MLMFLDATHRRWLNASRVCMYVNRKETTKDLKAPGPSSFVASLFARGRREWLVRHHPMLTLVHISNGRAGKKYWMAEKSALRRRRRSGFFVEEVRNKFPLCDPLPRPRANDSNDVAHHSSSRKCKYFLETD